MNASEAAFAAVVETLIDGTAELYAKHLGHTLPVVLPMELVTERQGVYREMRATLIALWAFAELADRSLGRERCRELYPAFDLWLGHPGSPGHIQVLLESTCDCCGTNLSQFDLLGREQFQIGQFQQACTVCFDLLRPGFPRADRRLARLQAFASKNPDRLAATVVAALERRSWNVEQAERALHISSMQFLQIVLFQSSVLRERALGTKLIAKLTGCAVEPLQALLADGM